MAAKDRVREAASGEGPHEHAGGVLVLPAVLVDVLIGVAMLGVAIAFWVGASAIPARGDSGLTGPAAFPRGVAALLAACALLMMARSVAARLRLGHSRPIGVERPAYVAIAMGLMVAYPLLIGALGFYVGTGLWLPVLLWVAGYRRPLGVVLVSAGFLLFTKVVFEQLLGTPLP